MKNEVEQILDHLRTLEERGWPVRIDGPHKMQAFVLYPDDRRYYAFPLDWQDWRNAHEWRFEEILHGFIEREIERRGRDVFWAYQSKLQLKMPRSKTPPYWPERRPTLLEVLQAAVEVSNGR